MSPSTLSFLANPKYKHYLYETESSIVLVDEDIQLEKDVKPTLIRVKNARDCVARLLQLYESMKPKKQGVNPLAFISPKATIGKEVYIGAFAYIGDGVKLGDGCQIYPHATIMDGAQLGSNCIVYPNASIYQDWQQRHSPFRFGNRGRRLRLCPQCRNRQLRQDSTDRHRDD